MTWTTTSRKERLRSAGRTGWQEQADGRRVLQRDGYRCYLCDGPAAEVDHVVPLYLTGVEGDHDGNKRAVCVPCHRRKTKAETVAARNRYSRRRPAERHPGALGGAPA